MIKHRILKARSLSLGLALVLGAPVLAEANDKVTGVITYRNGSEVRTLDISAKQSSGFSGHGKFYYTDTKAGSFVATITMLRVIDNVAWAAGRIDMSSNSRFVGKWVFLKFSDGGRGNADFFWMGLADQTSSGNGVRNGLEPVEGPFRVTAGDVKVKSR